MFVVTTILRNMSAIDLLEFATVAATFLYTHM